MPGHDIEAAIRPPEEAVAHLPTVHLGQKEEIELRQGRPVEWRVEGVGGLVAVVVAGKLVAITESKEGRLRPKKVFGG